MAHSCPTDKYTLTLLSELFCTASRQDEDGVRLNTAELNGVHIQSIATAQSYPFLLIIIPCGRSEPCAELAANSFHLERTVHLFASMFCNSFQHPVVSSHETSYACFPFTHFEVSVEHEHARLTCIPRGQKVFQVEG